MGQFYSRTTAKSGSVLDARQHSNGHASQHGLFAAGKFAVRELDCDNCISAQCLSLFLNLVEHSLPRILVLCFCSGETLPGQILEKGGYVPDDVETDYALAVHESKSCLDIQTAMIFGCKDHQ